MCIVTAKSMTAAIKIEKTLENENIMCSIVNLDSGMTKKGCAYGVSFDCYFNENVRRLLSKKNVSYGELITV